MTMAALGLFEGTGIELEYMIVDRDSLAVRPIADEALKVLVGQYEMEVELGDVAWSNELALHVLELKTVTPVRSLGHLAPVLGHYVRDMNDMLEPFGATLMPTAMHPWMDPLHELRFWPHEQDAIYRAFDRIFDCKGHGWANLQSVHVNLPFANDDEFGRLHAAVRLVLPILPALAASSPIADGQLTGLMDTRLDVYRHNADRIPSVVGRVVPERVFSRADYERYLLQQIYDDLAPLDPEGILRHEWVNARGCIARFDRMAIEIRVLDVQECPRADVAIAALASAVIQGLVEERWASVDEQRYWSERDLDPILTAATKEADDVVIESPAYLSVFGYPGTRASGRELWSHILEATDACVPDSLRACLDIIVQRGCLARRIRSAVGDAPTSDRLHHVYSQLVECLHAGRMFVGHDGDDEPGRREL